MWNKKEKCICHESIVLSLERINCRVKVVINFLYTMAYRRISLRFPVHAKKRSVFYHKQQKGFFFFISNEIDCSNFKSQNIYFPDFGTDPETNREIRRTNKSALKPHSSIIKQHFHEVEASFSGMMLHWNPQTACCVCELICDLQWSCATWIRAI